MEKNKIEKVLEERMNFLREMNVPEEEAKRIMSEPNGYEIWLVEMHDELKKIEEYAARGELWKLHEEEDAKLNASGKYVMQPDVMSDNY